ncbi:DUF3088 family protein [Kiloniella laminariae]|uniref:DUF3088 family protein n=1 Tax=Kiloniella laminariae TaxID=454162 RepID=A0ABT4LFS7_9PROT|nr:DUF3088 family protein [Kiloniella laminariae]MCZ4279959.1 DUF3088 family protein [Kiloniella laminariae]
MKPRLFVLEMPFTDPELVPPSSSDSWFCSHCALIEGALMVNPQWLDHIELKRIAFPRPRQELVALLGEDKQWLPVLVLSDWEGQKDGEKQTITDPVAITRYLAEEFGGAAPHP